MKTENMPSRVVTGLQQFAKAFDQRLDEYLVPRCDVPPELLEAMRYSTLGPGKRIRPFLVSRCCEIVGGNQEDSWPVACAIECVHAFSLIHDDLPAMDNDELRRGRPTCHMRYGEAVAILAGDALLALSFELLADPRIPADCHEMVALLAQGVGWGGMIGGQAADVIGEELQPELARANYIHQRKTARLFQTSCHLGALCGRGSAAQIDALKRYGQMLGRAFQIVDDLLDLTATTDVLGKMAQKDGPANKQTFPQCVGIEESRAAANRAAQEALAAIEAFGDEVGDLRDLTVYVTNRNY